MGTMENVPMTPEGFAAMKKQLAELKALRVGISREIEVAREHGDLKENAEYHAAKDKQGISEAHIRDMEDKLSRAEVIDPATLGGDRVKFGATVDLEDVESGQAVTYRIVGADESNIDEGTISVTSPVGRALINKEAGDEVRVKAPGGIRVYEVQNVRW